MKKILTTLLMVLALIAMTGCNDATASNSGEKSTKCGADKKAEKTTKCAGEQKDDKTMKCGEGKCGGGK